MGSTHGVRQKRKVENKGVVVPAIELVTLLVLILVSLSALVVEVAVALLLVVMIISSTYTISFNSAGDLSGSSNKPEGYPSEVVLYCIVLTFNTRFVTSEKLLSFYQCQAQRHS